MRYANELSQPTLYRRASVRFKHRRLRLRRKVTPDEFKNLNCIFELSELSFVDDSGSDGVHPPVREVLASYRRNPEGSQRLAGD